MKKLFVFSEKVLESPFTQMGLAIMFLYSGIEDIITDFKTSETGVKTHHGIALYGLFMLVKSFLALLKVIRKLEKKEKQTGLGDS